MANIALAVAEAALRARKLDRTLTTTLPLAARTQGVAATEVEALDARLHGGLPRGQLCEIAGAPSSGRTAATLQIVAAATRRGEITAIVDAFDRLDVASVAEAGVDLDRLLWIRGASVSASFPLSPSPLPDRLIERSLKALNLVLQAGGFGVVVLDLVDVPGAALNRIPFTTWLRIQRTVEGSETVCLLLAPRPIARSAGGMTLTLGGRSAWEGEADRSRRLAGLDFGIRVVSPRRTVDGDVTCSAR